MGATLFGTGNTKSLVGSRVADVGKGAHHVSTAEDYDILVESTDPDLSRD
jgi:hypothetical protein